MSIGEATATVRPPKHVELVPVNKSEPSQVIVNEMDECKQPLCFMTMMCVCRPVN